MKFSAFILKVCPPFATVFIRFNNNPNLKSES
jgi:hypothetical protein